MRFRVVGTRAYRGHAPGTEFEAVLDMRAARRAIMRGDIKIIATVVPTVPAAHALPRDWATPHKEKN